MATLLTGCFGGALGDYTERDAGMHENEWMDLAEEAGQLREAMAHRAPIEQAKGILMAINGCNPEKAFSLLKRASQDHNVKLWVLCVALIEAASSEASTETDPAACAALAALLARDQSRRPQPLRESRH